MSGLAHVTQTRENVLVTNETSWQPRTESPPVRHHWRRLVRRYTIPQHYSVTRNRVPDKANSQRQGPDQPTPNRNYRSGPTLIGGRPKETSLKPEKGTPPPPYPSRQRPEDTPPEQQAWTQYNPKFKQADCRNAKNSDKMDPVHTN